jgi:hypothetical protein
LDTLDAEKQLLGDSVGDAAGGGGPDLREEEAGAASLHEVRSKLCWVLLRRCGLLGQVIQVVMLVAGSPFRI